MEFCRLVSLIVLVGSVTACSRVAPPTGSAAEGDRSQAVREFGRQVTEVVWNRAQVGRLGEFYVEAIVRHVPERPDPIVGLEANKAYIRQLVEAFPDSHIEIRRMLVDGEWAAMHWVWTGTHTRNLPGLPPTGRKVRLVGVSIVHLGNGKAVEIWDFDDQLSMLQQLGVIPPLPAAGPKT